jgi:hypothetical protein
VSLRNVSVNSNGAQFDDGSNYASIPEPNVIVRGMPAQNLLSALAAAGINDCDPTRTVFLICNSFGGAPNCGYQWQAFQMVGSSELLPTCGPSATTSQGATLDAASSSSIWRAVLAAATASGFRPSSGTLAQTTVINARYFSWDGSNLGFTLVTGDAVPP